MTNDAISQFLTEQETAIQLGLKVSTLRNWHAARKGPPRTKVGRIMYYRREALVEWMRGKETNPENPAAHRQPESVHLVQGHRLLSSLNLPTRLRRLIAEGCVTVNDVRRLTEAELLRLPNFGRRSLADLKALGIRRP